MELREREKQRAEERREKRVGENGMGQQEGTGVVEEGKGWE